MGFFKLDKTTLDLLKLIERSDPKDGWYEVTIFGLFQLYENMPKGLVETKLKDRNSFWVRLTDEGKTLLKWL